MEYVAYIFIAFVAFYLTGVLSGNFVVGLLSVGVIFSIMIILEKLSEINKKLEAIMKKLNEEEIKE